MNKIILSFFIIMMGQVYGQVSGLILSNRDNMKFIPKDKYELINSELNKIAEKFTKEFYGDEFWKSSKSEYTGTTTDKWCVSQCLLQFRNPGYGEQVACNQHCSRANYNREIVNRTFTINDTLSYYEPEWMEIVEFYDGYSNLPSGVNKETKSLFGITKRLSHIELTGPNSCTAIIVTSGDENYGLKFYDEMLMNLNWEMEEQVDISEIKIEGTYSLPQFSFYEITQFEKLFSERLTPRALPEDMTFTEARRIYEILKDKEFDEFTDDERRKYGRIFLMLRHEFPILEKFERKKAEFNQSISYSFEFPENDYVENVKLAVSESRLKSKIKSAVEATSVIKLMIDDLVTEDDIKSHPSIEKMNEEFKNSLMVSSAMDLLQFSDELEYNGSNRSVSVFLRKLHSKYPQLYQYLTIDIECDAFDKMIKKKIQDDLWKIANIKGTTKQQKKNVKRLFTPSRKQELLTFGGSIRFDDEVFTSTPGGRPSEFSGDKIKKDINKTIYKSRIYGDFEIISFLNLISNHRNELTNDPIPDVSFINIFIQRDYENLFKVSNIAARGFFELKEKFCTD